MKKWSLMLILWSSGAVVVWSHDVLAVHPDFLQSYLEGRKQALAPEQLAQRADWFECSEQDTEKSWCSEPFYYYATRVWAQTGEATPIARPSLILHTDYTLHSWSQLQLGLRSDGFELRKVTVGEARFDVVRRLQHQTPQQVDRELVLFISQHARQFPKTLYWQARYGFAELHSNAQSVQLLFTQAPVSTLWDDAAETQP